MRELPMTTEYSTNRVDHTLYVITYNRVEKFIRDDFENKFK